MNEEHLKILRQGVEVWNAWREDHPEEQPDLQGADLRHVELMDAQTQSADLRNVDLRDVLLLGVKELVGARLQGANLAGADLQGADLRLAELQGANLRNVDLRYAILVDAELQHANLRGANLGVTLLCDLDLSEVQGLKEVVSQAPSTIGTDTLARSRGRIPTAFLRGCGLSDWEIEAAKFYNPDLTDSERTDIAYEILRIQGESPIQLNPLFISYSHADAAFVEALKRKLQAKRIRFWRDVHDMKAGRMETQIDRAMRLNPTVLLVLSEHSVESDWVRWEVSQARELEKELKRDVLCPVALDEAWKTCDWPGPLRQQVQDYYILDFSAWEQQETFEGQFGRLVEGLGIFYPGKTPSGGDADG